MTDKELTRAGRRGSRRAPFWTLARRRWAYGVVTALVPVAVIYGLVTAEQAAALLVLAGAALGVAGLALAHPTQK